MEHRWGRRVTSNITARVGEVSGSNHLARLTDLSISGAFLRISLPVNVLHPIYVELPCATQKRGPILEAYVVRRTGDGVGIEWAELGPIPILQLLATFQSTGEAAGAASAELRQSG